MSLKKRSELFELLPSGEEMTGYDRYTIETQGITSLSLMETAGTGCADYLLRTYSESQYLILCGPGNNGGDGFVIARKLKEKEKAVLVVELATNSPSTDQKINRERFETLGGRILDSNNLRDTNLRTKDEPLVILDALLGTGQKGALRKNVYDLLSFVKSVSNSKDKIIAIDVPTGVDPTTGEVYDGTLVADRTLTIEFKKRGLTQAPAINVCGEVVTIPIGIVPSEMSEFTSPSSKYINSKLPARAPGGHKGDFGHVLIIGGSRDMPGAPVLAARAALYGGCGKVTVVTPTELSAHLSELPEVMWKFIHCKDGYFDSESLEQILPLFNTATAITLGPGLGRDNSTKAFVKKLLESIQKSSLKLTLDADSLFPELLTNLSAEHCVLTPHPGEAARLLQCSSSDIADDRFDAAKRLEGKFGCPVLLKGAGSIVATKEFRFINPTGNSAMATAGSGDVLSGLITSLMAQGLSPSDALAVGVYVHGLAGDIAVAELGDTLVATDIARYIPKALRSIREAASE